MKDRVIVTSVIGDKYQAIWKLTSPTFEVYADRIGADILVLKENPHQMSAHWVKFALHNILKDMYKRALWLDADIIIRDDTPDLFSMVPEDKLGVFNEGRFTPRAIALYEAMMKFKVQLPKWDRKSYYNTGVMVVSQEQRHLFNDVEKVPRMTYGFGEQTFLNMRIQQRDMGVYEFSHHFNRMSLMNGITGVSRLASYIVHYAGFEGGNVLEVIKDDLWRWGETPYSKFNAPTLFINVGGGLGDQVCAEPTVRYIRNVLYPDAVIYVTTSYPELFSHIPNISVSDKAPTDKVDAVYRIDTHPDKETGYHQYSLSLLSHTVDYISMTTLKRVLTLEDRQIKLPNSGPEVSQDYSIRDLVLVHPGQGWPSKTFPVEWWQEIIDGLDEEGYRVGIIGRDLKLDMEHTYLPVKCPSSGIDFRDRLSTLALMDLLKYAPVLISNDSAPIHLAGAYDNWIILIPTCKHPEYLLPCRHGSIWYKAKALYKELSCDDYPFRPTEIEVRSFAHTVRPIMEYLPDPQEVIKVVKSITATSSVEGATLTQTAAMKGHDHEYDIIQPNG